MDVGSWGRALDDFAAWLSRMEAQLDADEWDESPAPLALPVLTSTPNEAELTLAMELQQRLTVCEERIRTMLDDTADELQALKHRRKAARNYAERGQGLYT